jgi:phenylacetic acid degradation operon negative regulatory protein
MPVAPHFEKNRGRFRPVLERLSIVKSKASDALDRFLNRRMKEGQISATSLVFTFFCDVVTQHGGEIWLGSIIHVLAPLGINERLTRTAVFRLVKDGWLESRKLGRRSYYRLSPTGQNYYQRAAQRIYANSKPEWNGAWSLLFTSLVPEEKRDALNRGLLWLGYGRMAATVFAMPCFPDPALGELLADLEMEDSVVCMRAEADSTESLSTLVLAHWKLNDVRKSYRFFTTQYQKAEDIMSNDSFTNGHSRLLLRILLVHEYRKILLSDPELPTAMLPTDWEGFAARSLAGSLYRQLAEPTTNWANCELSGVDGLMVCESGNLAKRFAV